jgi:hypothetical protein
MAELNTSQINERLWGVKVTGELIVELGIAPTRREKRAMYWDESLFPQICDQLVEHIRSAYELSISFGDPQNLAQIQTLPPVAAPTVDDLFGE